MHRRKELLKEKKNHRPKRKKGASANPSVKREQLHGKEVKGKMAGLKRRKL